MIMQKQRRTAATVAVVGAGRLGRPLSRALAAGGLTVRGPLRRGEGVGDAGVVVLCVPDAEIASSARALRDDGFAGRIGHTSGATPLDAAGADFGLHPMQTFTGDERPEVFAGVGCAIAGATPDALELARALADAVGARAFPVADANRAAYHAAGSIASNYLITLLDAAEQVAGAAGLSDADARALLEPLVSATVRNWARLGPRRALTGPVARGDAATVERQRQAVADAAPHLLEAFDALREATRLLAGRETGTA